MLNALSTRQNSKKSFFKRLRIGCYPIISRDVKESNGVFFCWRNWPVWQSDYDKNVFVDPMVKLFVEESKIDAEYILTIYDGLFDRRSEDSHIFNQFREDPEDFIAFSRNIKHIRPHFLINALLKYIRDGKNGYGGYTADIEKLKSSCNELYENLETNESLAESQLERITRELILYSYPELPWYNQLPQKLWEIEKKKNSPDKQSLRNYFIVANNAPKNSSFIDEINQSYRKWIEVYKVQNWANVDSLIKHTKEMLDLVNSSLHATYPNTRNKSFDKPNSFLLVGETLSSYWEMIDFFKVHDFELYLYALETALEKPTFTVEVTENLGSKAKQLFVDSFEEFCVSDVEKASLLVTYMISRSGYTEIKIHIRKVLDIIYPVLAKIDSPIAEKALSDGLKPEHSHMPLWRPRLSK